MAKFLRRFRGVLGKAWLANIFGGLAACFQLAIPLATIAIINHAIPERSRSLLFQIALLMALAIILAVVLSYLENYYTAVFRQRAGLVLEMLLFEQVHRQSFEFFKSRDGGYIMSRMSHDSGIALDAISSITNLGRALVMLGAGLILLRLFDLRLGLLTAAILPVYAMLLGFFSVRTRDAFVQVSEKTALASKELYDSITGIYETKAYGSEKYRALKYFQTLASKARSFIRGRSLLAAGEHVTHSITFLVALIVITYGGLRVIEGRLSLGEMISFSTIAAYLLIPVNFAVQHTLRAQQSLASIQRVEEWLALPGEEDLKRSTDSEITRRRADGHIRFEGVTFAFKDRPILLQDIHLEIAPGEVILITGASGAGKTTLVNLLPRFLEPLSGTIYIDDIPIKLMPLRYLRQQIAYVSQDVFLFSDTIANNIRVGNRKASDEEVREAARLANALDFIQALPQGFATEVGERGSRLSGGQKQRISIARAILRRAPVLILDEATSAVDPETEALVHESLAHLMKNRTTIIIAHHATAFLETVNRNFTLEDCQLRPASPDWKENVPISEILG
jgi:ABC-type bacteriocin/lantibiotic exporter with double-glycine peptidase domain